MRFDDWVNTAAFIGIGFFLGLAAYALAGLFLNSAWLLALAVLLPWLGWLLFYVLLDGLAERLFPSGAKQARRADARRTKLIIRRLSLPLGLGLGVLADWLGLTETILQLLG